MSPRLPGAGRSRERTQTPGASRDGDRRFRGVTPKAYGRHEGQKGEKGKLGFF